MKTFVANIFIMHKPNFYANTVKFINFFNKKNNIFLDPRFCCGKLSIIRNFMLVLRNYYTFLRFWLRLD